MSERERASEQVTLMYGIEYVFADQLSSAIIHHDLI